MYRRCTASAFILAIAAILATAVDTSVTAGDAPPHAATQRGERERLTWDLSKPITDRELGWPAEFDGDLWFLRGPGIIELKLPGGRAAEYYADRITVRRNGHRIAAVGLALPPEKLEAVYKRATAIAAEWQIQNVEKLDRWHADRQRDHGNSAAVACELGNFKDSPAVHMRLGRGSAVDETWWVDLSFGFPVAKPGTQPTTGQSRAK
jgi:hypothetical protein